VSAGGASAKRIRPLDDHDAREVGALLDETVGAGFHDVAAADGHLSFVAEDADGLAGVIAATAASYEDLRSFYAASSRLPGFALQPPPSLVAHIRELAVAPRARRWGLAASLLDHTERAARAALLEALVVNAWLPTGVPDPPAVRLYVSHGFAALGDIPGFFAAPDVAPDGACPYCGEPPCRCAVRVFVKDLRG
jgi:ribosomal protein S18 acetylase RimI-like enzyme